MILRISSYSPKVARTQARAFTLLEILIVAALITLFSSLAVLSWNHYVQDSKRKSATVDTSAIGRTLGSVYFDLGFLPKIGYLSVNQQALTDYDYLFKALPPQLDAIGYDTTLNTRRDKILQGWIGPYLPNPKPRMTSGRNAFYCQMELPGVASNNQFVELDWPADPWGQPYMLYLVHIYPYEQGGDVEFINSPFQKANYVRAVVSYGPNRVPGGWATDSPYFSNDALAPGDYEAATRSYWLFVEEVRGQRFRALRSTEYNDNRLNALHNAWGWEKENFSRGYLASHPDFPGILDLQVPNPENPSSASMVTGSDDIIYFIP